MARVRRSFWPVLSLILIEIAILLLYVLIMNTGLVPYQDASFSTIGLELLGLLVFVTINHFFFKQAIWHSAKHLYRNLLLLLPVYLYLLYGAVALFQNYILPSDLIIYLLTAIVTGISEEYLFRGLILTRLLSVSKTTLLPLILTSVLFGLMHIVHLFNQPLFTTLNQVIQVSFIGFTAGALYLATHSIYFPIILHAAADIVAFVLTDINGGQSDSWTGTFISVFVYTLIGLVYYFIYRRDSYNAIRD